MKKIKILLLSLILASLSLPTFGAASDNAKKHDRQISVQAYTFRNNTLEEVLKILSELSVKYVECYPEQKLSDKYPNARVDWNLNAEQRAFLKKLMKDTGVQMKSYGCTMKSPRPVAELEAQVKNVCEFAADMGVEQVQTEAKFCEIPMWLKYAKNTALQSACITTQSTPTTTSTTVPKPWRIWSTALKFRPYATLGIGAFGARSLKMPQIYARQIQVRHSF